MNALHATAGQTVIDEENELERLRAELHAAHERERKLTALLADQHGAFVSKLTHDLKNPLTTIMGRIEMLKRVVQRPSITSADIERHLTPLDEAVNRLQHLLHSASERDERRRTQW